MTEGNAAAIPDNDGSGGISADNAVDIVDAIISIIGTASDGDTSVVSTYY